MGRAITDPAVWKLGYGAIIVGEALTGLCFLAAAIALISDSARTASALRTGEDVGRRRWNSWVSGLVSGLRCDRWGVVPDVAIPDLEWPGTGLPLRDDHPGHRRFIAQREPDAG